MGWVGLLPGRIGDRRLWDGLGYYTGRIGDKMLWDGLGYYLVEQEIECYEMGWVTTQVE